MPCKSPSCCFNRLLFYFIVIERERERERQTCVFLKRQKIRDLTIHIKFALYFITYNTHATFIIMLTTTEKMTTEALAGTFCAFFLFLSVSLTLKARFVVHFVRAKINRRRPVLNLDSFV